jgi:hypothetical protein
VRAGNQYRRSASGGVSNKPVLTSTSSPVLSHVEAVESSEPVLSNVEVVEWIKTPKSTIGNRKSKIYSTIDPFTHTPIHLFIQNEPNLNQPSTRFARQITQTVAILLPTFLYLYFKKMQKSAHFSSEIPKKRALFPNFYAKRTQFQPENEEIRATKHANDVDFTTNFSSKTTNFSKEVHKKSICFSSTLTLFYSFSRRKRELLLKN